MAACNSCGTAVADANVLYTADARIVCARCYAAADIVEIIKAGFKQDTGLSLTDYDKAGKHLSIVPSV